LPRGADAATLPALSFRVSQAGRLLTLPLEELLLPQRADGRREFCIRSYARSAAAASPDGPNEEVPILLGTQARTPRPAPRPRRPRRPTSPHAAPRRFGCGRRCTASSLSSR
jgi:hypothetical protein